MKGLLAYHIPSGIQFPQEVMLWAHRGKSRSLWLGELGLKGWGVQQAEEEWDFWSPGVPWYPISVGINPTAPSKSQVLTTSLSKPGARKSLSTNSSGVSFGNLLCLLSHRTLLIPIEAHKTAHCNFLKKDYKVLIKSQLLDSQKCILKSWSHHILWSW